MIALLYLLTVIIWGSTWLAIKMQLGIVPPMWSITYRFGMASLILFITCIVMRKKLRFSVSTHMHIALQGVLMFCLNYFFFYLASEYIVTGLVAVIFAMMAIFNIFTARLILKSELSKLMLLGATTGIFGLIFVLRSELAGVSLGSMLHGNTLLAFGYCLLATLIASFASIVAAINLKNNVPVLQGNAYGMMYGAGIMAIFALLINHAPTFSWHSEYLFSLLYLAVFGTVVAFGFYLTLIKHIGPERASYVFILTPIVAMIVSTYFESFTWNLLTLFGIALVILGNILVMKGKMRMKL